MIELRLREIASAVSGMAAVGGDGTVDSVVTDSRAVAPGALFVAVAGEHVDGHDFVAQAQDRGAVCSLVSRPVAGPHILVGNTVQALGLLAAEVVRRSTATVVAVTGSSGKTTTKDLLALVLARRG